MNALVLRWRVWRHKRASDKADRAWLATNPSTVGVMREVNRRRTEWARLEVDSMDDD